MVATRPKTSEMVDGLMSRVLAIARCDGSASATLTARQSPITYFAPVIAPLSLGCCDDHLILSTIRFAKSSCTVSDVMPPSSVGGMIKTTHFSVDFSSLQSLKIGISPGRKKVSYGKPTEKWVVFIRGRKTLPLFGDSGLSGGKGMSRRATLWIS